MKAHKVKLWYWATLCFTFLNHSHYRFYRLQILIICILIDLFVYLDASVKCNQTKLKRHYIFSQKTRWLVIVIVIDSNKQTNKKNKIEMWSIRFQILLEGHCTSIYHIYIHVVMCRSWTCECTCIHTHLVCVYNCLMYNYNWWVCDLTSLGDTRVIDYWSVEYQSF